MLDSSQQRTGPLATFMSFLPRGKDFDLRFARVDLLAGITVAFVALPLALGFGVTSGAGATAGIITAIVAGFVAALAGGSNFQVSGPTGAMTAVLLPIVAQHGPAALPVLCVLAGLILIVMGVVRVGRYVRYIPWPVVTGFTNGIGVIIFLQQLPNVLGVAQPRGESIVTIAYLSVREWATSPGFMTIALALLTVFVMVAWRNIKALAAVPASMAALMFI